MRHVIVIVFMLCMNACGGGSSSGSGAAIPALGVIPLKLGVEAVDSALLDKGQVRIRFPSADGDSPRILRVVVAGSIADGLSELPDLNSSIQTDGVVIYLPFSGTYTITISVGDIGDEEIDHVVHLSVPLSQCFSLSGNVEDGEIGSESGVSTSVHLHWHPSVLPSKQIATVHSNASDNGSFTFSKLVGDASNFDLVIAESE